MRPEGHWIRAVQSSLLAAVVSVAHAAEPLPDLSLEELLQTDVQIASRKAQRLQDVAAAVFVITREDIERAGVTSIPDALRLVPGLQVAQLSSNRWAVSARGFNGRFANKLLVLMDGRSIYSRLFSGVLWETEDTLLEDIDRIEVIRGPGASLWGANAVNGVINIITRKARQTLGTLVAAGAGTEDRASIAMRHGVALGSGSGRVWAKAYARDPSADLAGRAANDDWRASRVGFRGDWTLGDGRLLTLSGAAFDTRGGDTWKVPNVTDPRGYVPTEVTQESTGGHLLGRYEWLGADGSAAVLQGYFMHTQLGVGALVDERRDTVDLDFQHRPLPGEMHDIVWGLGYRESSDRIDSAGMLDVQPRKRRWRLFSAFVQDEVTLAADRLRAILGARLEHSSDAGTELQPNLRLIWTPSTQRTLWAALSRAVRTPSRGEQDAELDFTVIPARPPLPPILLHSVRPPGGLESERLIAFELGLRQQLGTQLYFDLALFSNRYTRLRGAEVAPPTFETDPVLHAIQNILSNSEFSARTHGAELAIDWRASPTWRLQLGYSYLDIDARTALADLIAIGNVAAFDASAPRHQLSLRASWSPGERLQFDFWLRHAGAMDANDPSVPAIPSYTTLDLRLAWRPRPGLELSIVGQNLLDAQHPEFTPELLPSQALQVERALRLKALWQF